MKKVFVAICSLTGAGMIGFFLAGQKFPDRTNFDPPRNLLAAAID